MPVQAGRAQSGQACPGFQQAGAFWSRRSGDAHEYRVVRDGNHARASLCERYLFASRYEQARAELSRLLEEYRGIPIEDSVPGEEIDTPAGPCFRVTSTKPAPRWSPEPDRVMERLSSDLVLVHGIGPVTAGRLRGRGYRSLECLATHPVYGTDASRAASEIRDRDLVAIQRRIERWRGASHPHAMMTAALMDPEDLVFFDIETLGIFSRPIVLFGCGRMVDGEIRVTQFILRDVSEEEAALHAVAREMDRPGGAVVTYNGRAFDLPYLRDRWAYYGSPGVLPEANFDLLHFSRRLLRGRLRDFRLGTLERSLFGIRRPVDVPGAMVPEFYDAYQRTGNPGPLVPVLAHNRQDVVSLVHLMATLWREGCGGS